MKKTIVSTLVLGLLISGTSVFAERDDESKSNNKKSSSFIKKEEDNHKSEIRGNLFSLKSSEGDDDIRIPTSPEVSIVNLSREDSESVHMTSLSRMKARATQLIRERINALEANKKVINGGTSLTAEQKAALTAVLSTNSNNLTVLSTQVASSTDATSTKLLINRIYTDFRIFGVVIPQVRLEKRIYDLQNHSTKLSDTFLKVQAKIDEYKGKGKDVSVWQKGLDDAKILVANDMNTLAIALTKVQALTPADYKATSTMVMNQANIDIKKVSKDFSSISKIVRKPSGMKNISATSTPTIPGGTSTSLVGASFIWVSAINNGTTTLAPAGDRFVLTFGINGHMSSKTDCNNLMGGYQVGTSSLSFGMIASTMMFCDGSQEGVYSQLLAKTSSYLATGTTLTLSNGTTSSMIFKRK